MADIEEPIGSSSMEEFLRKLIQRRAKLAERREELQNKAESVLMVAREQGRENLESEEDAELGRYMSEMRGIGKDIEALDDRITEVGEEVRRSGAINSNLARIRNTEKSVLSVKEAVTYQQGDSRRSYMQDLVKMSLNLDSTGECRDRLMRHAQDVATRPEYQELRADGGASRVDGFGGYAVPPAWMMDQFVEIARPGRAFANLVQRQPLPGGTDSINIPKLVVGTDPDVQDGDNTDVSEPDAWEDTFINAPVRTIAGSQGVAIQLIDQSPIAFDDVVFRDLTAAHAAKTDQLVLGGTGLNGQILGVTGTPGIQTVPATSVDIQGVYAAIANAIQKVHTTRFLPPEVIVMHPRRWGWFLSLLDTQDRPLFLPAANNGMNLAGVLQDVASQQVVGTMHGLPVVTDPNVPLPGDKDSIFVLRSSDLILWESGIRARVLPETKAQTLTVLLQIYNYIAFTAARYPQSVVQIPNLDAPTF